MYRYDGSRFVETSGAFATEAAASSKTVANSVLNPMTYHLASSLEDSGVLSSTDSDIIEGFDVSNNDNLEANQCFSNMVRPDERRSLWGYSASSGYGVTTTKTMYDPCPPGYIVAHYLVWTNTERSWSKLYYSSLDGGFLNHGATAEDGGIFLTNDNYKDDNDKNYFDPAWYPYSGYISGRSFETKESGEMGVFHTSTPAGNGARSLMYNSSHSGQGVDDNDY